MTQSRFLTAVDVFDAYPGAAKDIKAKPAAKPPLEYLRGLIASETPEDALSFASYYLPKREAVWWGCQCLRSLLGPSVEGDPGMRAAEDWVKDPGEQQRRATLDYALQCDREAPVTWLALAAGWSGGSMTASNEHPIPAPPDLAAKSVRAAVLIGLSQASFKDRQQHIKNCVDAAVRLAEKQRD